MTVVLMLVQTEAQIEAKIVFSKIAPSAPATTPIVIIKIAKAHPLPTVRMASNTDSG